MKEMSELVNEVIEEKWVSEINEINDNLIVMIVNDNDDNG